MSFFTRIRLDEHHPRAREAVARLLDADPRSDHELLWQFFPSPPGTARDFIFRRVDAAAAFRLPFFYVVSCREPRTIHEAWIVESKAYDPELERGAQLEFEVRLNPVRHEMRERSPQERETYEKLRRAKGLQLRPGPSRRKVYHDVIMHAKREWRVREGAKRWSDIPADRRPEFYELVHQTVRGWFCGTDGRGGLAARHGFAVEVGALRVEAYRQHRIMRPNGQRMQYSTVDVSGILQVSDPVKFRNALLTGLGRAKAFGCGLLLVRRFA